MIIVFFFESMVLRMKFAVKHDDRLDCLAQGVKYFTDALSISAESQIKMKKEEEFLDLLEAFIDHPQEATNHLVLGLNKDQREECRGKSGGKSVPTWT